MSGMTVDEFKDHLYDALSLIPEFWTSLSTDDFLVNTREKSIGVVCSDIFAWGCADVEDIESSDDIELLRQSIKDCLEIEQRSSHGVLLYCARKRQMRPQGAYYKYLDVYDYKKDQPRELNEEATEKMHKLFNDAGPKREVGLGNPFEVGEYR